MTTSVAPVTGTVRTLRPAAGTLSLVLADEHPVVRSGLRALLEVTGGMRVVAEARSGREAGRGGLLPPPHVLVLGLGLRDPDRVSAIPEGQRAKPRIAVLVVTLCEDGQ